MTVLVKSIFIEKLKVYLELEMAINSGEHFTFKRMKRVAVQLFYGNKLIDLAKGKNAVEVSNGDELISVLMKLKDAISDGSLDTQIEVASESVKARFQK